ncbi:class I SAM-dependent methyltransferase [Aurantivibrio infirmus]
MAIELDTSQHKSRHIKRTAGVLVLKKKHPIMKKLKKKSPAPVIHGDKIWSSSYLIINHLANNPIAKRSKVMEVGCGWGLLSVYCASAFNAKVTGIDADQNVLPYLKALSTVNSVKVKAKKDRFQRIKKKTLAKQDLVVGGDICFWDKLTEHLYKLIKRSVKAGVKKIIIADPGRTPFFKLAKRWAKKFGNTKLLESNIKWPEKVRGYLLIIEP